MCRVILVLCLFMTACSVPDGSDMDGLIVDIQALPDDTYSVLSAWVAKNVIEKYTYDHADESVGRQTCRNPDGTVYLDGDVDLDDIAICLVGVGWNQEGWDTCVKRLGQASDWMGPGVTCEFKLYPRWSWEEIVDRASAENQDRINRAWVSLMVTTLIASSTPPPVALSPSFLAKLCGLSAGWACPGSPSVPISGAASTGGDYQ